MYFLQLAFDPKKNPLDVPIVQVSLLGNEDPNQHYRMGQALEQLRDEGVLIIGAGMAVHNLYDFRKARGDTSKAMPSVIYQAGSVSYINLAMQVRLQFRSRAGRSYRRRTSKPPGGHDRFADA